MYAAVLIAVLFVFSGPARAQIVGILIGATLVAAVGILDDRGLLHHQVKLFVGMPLAAAQPGYPVGWRAMPSGSRPASSQPRTAANSGMPTRMISRFVTGILVSEDSPSSWLAREKPRAAT